MKKIIPILFAICYLIFNIAPAGAFTMSNDNWVLQMGNFNTASGKPTGPSNKLSLTVGQTSPGLYTGTNFKVRSGFQYISSIIPFAFSIDNISIDFGTLSPTNPITRTNTLTVSNGSANGYSVTAFENHQLLVPAIGSVIPDTTCDNGSCSQTTSAAWTNILTYGFGYRCDNLVRTDCASGFASADNYKQFADNSKSETAVSVMSGTNASSSAQVRITYKLNISNTQAAGLYNNVITYIATPTF